MPTLPVPFGVKVIFPLFAEAKLRDYFKVPEFPNPILNVKFVGYAVEL